MKFLSWRRDYEIGVPRIDAEHRSLFDLVNEVHAKRAQGASRKEIFQVLNRLVAYAEEHFQHEESLMSENGYPLLDQHLEQHRALVSSIFAINERLAADPDKASTEILQFVKNWLVVHILKHDMDIADFLRRKVNQAIKTLRDQAKKKLENTVPPGSAIRPDAGIAT